VARGIRPELARRSSARHRICRRGRWIGIEALAGGGETLAIELGIIVSARTHAVIGKGVLVSISEGRAIARSVSAEAAVAKRERLDFRQKLLGYEVHDLAQPRSVGAERRMHIEAAASAGAGRVGRGQCRMAIGHEHDARQITADQRLQRGAQFRKIVGQRAVKNVLRVRHLGDMAAAAEQSALRPRLDDDVTNESRKPDVIGADREQHEIEGTVGATGAGLGQGICEGGDLRPHRARTGCRRAGARAFGDALATEETGADGRARAGEGQECYGEVRAFDCKRERGARLIAVERTVTRAAFPACTLPRPVLGTGIAAGLDPAGSVPGEAVAPGPIVFADAAAEEAAVTEPRVGQPHGPVGVALAGSNRIAHAGDQEVAYRNFGHDPLRGAVRERDVDARNGRLPVDDAQLYLFVAWRLDLPGITFAV